MAEVSQPLPELLESLIESSPRVRPRRPPARTCLGAPRMRKDWGDSTEQCVLGSRATIWETLWVVIFTMAIASMRDTELKLHDFEWFVLHFLVTYNVAFASIRYATRFNDEDAFHTLFWVAFLFGIFGQVMFLNHALAGFAGSTAFLYLLLVTADVRVAVCLPRARVFCLVSAASHCTTAGIFLYLALGEGAPGFERLLLWLHTLVLPVTMIGFSAVVSLTGRVIEWDVPLHIEHFIHRFGGLHMMIIVCSFLFPIALQGPHFCSSLHSMAAALLGILYAILLKLSIFDLSPFQHANPAEALMLHAIQRSRWTSLAFIISFPVSILGIAVAGVGFVSAVRNLPDELVRFLVCWGSFMTWTTLTLHKALHRAVLMKVHAWKVALLLICSSAFLIPEALELSSLSTLAFATATMLAVLSVQLLMELLLGGELKRWHWNKPRILKDWQDIQTGKQIGANVSSHEHLFTVLVAVAVFQLTEMLKTDHNLQQYILQYFIFYTSLTFSFTYASRFDDDDAAHKILWSLFQFALLFMLEGAGGDLEKPWSLFKVSVVGMFLLLSVFFFGRVAVGLPRARGFGSYFALVNFIGAMIFFATCFYDTLPPTLCWTFVAIMASVDFVFLYVVLPCNPLRADLDIPMNIEYIEARYEGLFVEVLGVAVIVPNAIFPGDFPQPLFVVAGGLMVATMVACVKITVCDTEALTFENHAIRRSQWSAVLFMGNNCVCNFSICLMGASMAMLIPAAGTGGWASVTPFAQGCACGASCLFWASTTATRLLHLPMCPRRRASKVAIQLAAGLAILGLAVNPASPGTHDQLSDIVLLGAVVVVHVAVVLLQWGVDIVLQNEERMEYPLPDDEELHGDLDGRAAPHYPIIWTPRRSVEIASLRRSVDMGRRQLSSRLSLSLWRTSTSPDIGALNRVPRLVVDIESTRRTSPNRSMPFQQRRVDIRRP